MAKLETKASERHSAVRTVLPIHDPVSLDHSCRRVLELAREQVGEMEKICSIDPGSAVLLEAWDELEVLIEDVFGPVSLMNEVHPVRSVREAADAHLIDLVSFTTELYQNERLYEGLLRVEPSRTEEVQMKRDLLESFEDSGVSLPAEDRGRIREISETITALSQEFAKNIREQAAKMRFTPAEVDGLPGTVLSELEQDGDDLLVGFDYPEYNPFMMTVHDEEARKRLFVAYQQRGGKRNLEILDQIVELRRELAAFYGLPSFAHYITRRRMVETPETVHAFLDDVLDAVREREVKDVEELRSAKSEATGTARNETEIFRWDVAYWSERVREQRYAIDQEEMRKYFPTLPSLEWVLAITERLYGIRFDRIEVPVWHRDVLYFDVIDDDGGEFIGGIYLDLYPREGKYKHAAAWPVRGVSRRKGRKPLSVLVTNFDRRGLTHQELETLLHEFGHVLHGVLSRTWFCSHAGTGVQRDFVEAPSQMYEEWGRRLESLALLAEICPECPRIDRDLVERIDASRRFGRGIHYARQHLYASFDMALAGESGGRALEVWRSMESITPLGYVERTMFPAAFGHITGGYAAGYYGYLWSETIARDLLSVFGSNLMDPGRGRRFRREILERGGEVPARQLVEEFLGRPVSPEAFIRELEGADQVHGS
jgi:thimet oligopeptidase